jgi:UDP-N-acetylglucosamine--N-acetylmuramyl-(pentapeptide) pyrophosphoryl-undecaprenol N-acetylglucosamine transferase
LGVSARKERDDFVLLAFGGSQGARRINDALLAAAPRLFVEIPRLRLIHQTGAADFERVRDRYRELGVTAEVLPFIEDMARAYADADLVLCRAGATTVAELTALGKPAILVPYPYAADDHQRANGEVLVQRGAAVLIADA